MEESSAKSIGPLDAIRMIDAALERNKPSDQLKELTGVRFPDFPVPSTPHDNNLTVLDFVFVHGAKNLNLPKFETKTEIKEELLENLSTRVEKVRLIHYEIPSAGKATSLEDESLRLLNYLANIK
jgi:hypothetical protein